jgi:drug/metabolite transporter (DMT)-like permease
MIMTAIAGFSGVATNSMEKFLGGEVDNLVLVFYQMITGVILCTQLLPAFVFNSVRIQHFDLNLGTIVLSLEFVWATLAGTLLYGEPITVYQILASVILVLSIVFMNLLEKKPSKQ